MTTCFWTDMVACSEDCSDAVAPLYAAFDFGGGGDGAFNVTVFDSEAAWLAQDPPGDNTNLEVVSATLWVPAGDSSENCVWVSTVVAAHDETPGSTSPDVSAGTLILQPASYFAAGSESTYSGTGALTVTAGVLSTDELLAFVSTPGLLTGVMLITLRNVSTGVEYIGSGSISFCS